MNPISSLKGIGKKTAALFGRLGIFTVEDLLCDYPREYEEYGQPVPIGELQADLQKTVSVLGRVRGVPSASVVRGKAFVRASVQDSTGAMSIIWYNALFMKNNLTAGGTYVFRGRVNLSGDRPEMIHPEIFSPEQYEEQAGKLLPVYSRTAGLSNKMIVKAVRQALEKYGVQTEFFPQDLLEKYNLQEYSFALFNIHFPKDWESLLKSRRRLVFDEFFFFLAGLRQMKESEERLNNGFEIKRRSETDAFEKALPYRLTHAQKKVWNEVREDLGRPYAMRRLIQGDVGSGKTVIAILALIEVGLNGFQGALMAPTEVLAKQHMASIQRMFSENHIPLHPILLTGSMTAKEKKEAYAKIESGIVDLVIGTHAIIQEKVVFKKLALVITDEQHRFGVRQRERLSEKGNHPHVLVMSATPIPRTLSIILYGDLDISVIDELPANRLSIKNCVVDGSYHKAAYRLIEQEVRAGRQAYVICPMVDDEEEDESGCKSVIAYEACLRKIFPEDIHTAYLHGRMKPEKKNAIMELFLQGEIQVLVSTTVIEVGVNVPNATVMMVENAERFGLAQLHQLRGRVGRGEYQSYCIFVSDTKNKDTQKRLQILNTSNDGFYIAGEDLKLRGPGDMFGIRQSGIMEFRIGDIFTDAGILKEAEEAVSYIYEKDPSLSLQEHILLKQRLDLYMRNSLT